MADAACAHSGPAEAEGRVSGEPMLVPPEPQHHAIQVGAQLATDARILPIEGAEPLMVAQKDHGAPVARFREDDLLQPTAANPVESNEVDNEFEEWETLGVVAGVQAHDAPIGIFEAEIARLLPQRRQGDAEVAVTAGVHLMVSVQRVGAARSPSLSSEPSYRPPTWPE